MKVAINTSVGESKLLTDEEQACVVIFARIPYIFVAFQHPGKLWKRGYPHFTDDRVTV